MDELPDRILRTRASNVVLLTAGTIAAMTATNSATGAELAFALFYAGPVSLVAWRFGNRAGFVTGVLCALLTLLTEVVVGSHDRPPIIYFVNFGIRLTTFVLVTLMITALRRTYITEHRLARTDGLTGAWNKRAFHERVETTLRQAAVENASVILAYVDLDNFKVCNDRHGHAAGDAVLLALAEAAQRELGPHDAFARIGGDEFILLLAERPEYDSFMLATEMHRRLSDALDALPYGVTCSMGALIVGSAEQATSDQLIRRADKLMYEVKRAGKASLRIATAADLDPGPPRQWLDTRPSAARLCSLGSLAATRGRLRKSGPAAQGSQACS